MAVYLVTGAGGYIGSMLVKHLLERKDDAQVVAVARSLQGAKDRMVGLWGEDFYGRKDLTSRRLELLSADLCDARVMDRLSGALSRTDYIIHCASRTQSAEMMNHPVEVAKSIVNATQNILEWAGRHRVKSLVYLSSMEVYGDIDCSDGHRVTEAEADHGRIGILSSRSCYPLGKRMAENLCYGYYREYGVPVKIARLAQTFGHGVPPTDGRVFAQFARSVKTGRDIVLHTEGRSMGNYCGIEDAVAGILTILERGQNGEAYNIVNEANTMTIRQMAELVATQVAGGKIQVRYDIPQDGRYGYAADSRLRLSGEKLGGLGWRPGKGLAEMYRDMLEDI